MNSSLAQNNNQFPFYATARDIFTPLEVAQVIKQAKTFPLGDGVMEGSRAQSYRTGGVRWVRNNDDTLWIFRRIADLILKVNSAYFHFELTKTEDLQFSEYPARKKGHYGVHCDVGHGAESRFRKLSVTVQLSDPKSYKGGDLTLYYGAIDTPGVACRERGSATVFNSIIIHEVTPVTKGTRYSLVTWAHGPPFR